MSKATESPDAIACAECGVEFKPRRPYQHYCTGPKDGPGNCQKKAERKRAKARGYKQPKVSMICHGCGSEFMGEKRKRKPGVREHRYCTHDCYSKHRRFAFRKVFTSKLDWRECQECNVTFISRQAKNKCQSCRAQPSHPRFVAGSCRECHANFVGKWHPTSPAQFCTAECSRRNKKRRYRKRHGRSDQHRKRARRYGVSYEPINRTIVFEQDGYRCGICGEMTMPGQKVPHPKAPTLDHRVPISRGGPHRYENVQCACFECNWKKGAGDSERFQATQLQLEFVTN